MMDWTSVRRNTRRSLLPGIAQLALCIGVPAVGAQSPDASGPIRAHLVVQADAACATKAELAARVRRRSQRIRFVEEPGAVPQLVVTMVAGSGERLEAGLLVHWPDGRRAERRLNARSCRSGLDAVALLVAMTLDPGTLLIEPPPDDDGDGEARVPDAPRRRSGPEAKAAAARSSAGDGDAADGDGAPPREQPATAESAVGGVDASHSPPPPSRAASGPWTFDHVAVGGHGQLVLEVAPGPMPGLGAYALLAMRGRGLFLPALSLRFFSAWSDELREPAGTAELTLDGAELAACPLGLRMQLLAARACLSGTLGRLTAAGSGSYSPRTHRRIWGSGGVSALFTVGLGRWLELRAGMGLAAALSRYRLAFRPDVFHRVPPIHFGGHIGAGVRFP